MNGDESSHEGQHDEAVLDNLTQPVELDHLEVHAAGELHLNHEWVAYLDEAHLPSHIAGIDDSLHHADHDGGTAYA